MRWKSKKPENEATRTKEVFAIVPHELSDGTVVWLENFFADQSYHRMQSCSDDTVYGRWLTDRTYTKDGSKE